MTLPRWLDPKTNPALYSAAVSIGIAIWQGIQVESGPLTWAKVARVAAPIVVAALITWQRGKTTPLADPKDGNGEPLLTRQAHAEANFKRAVEAGAVPEFITTSTAPPGTEIKYVTDPLAVQPSATGTGPAGRKET